MSQHFNSVDSVADHLVDALDGNISLGLPLALGKPVQLANALYRKAKADPSITLRIYTALSLGRPHAPAGLERRFLEPFTDRVFGDYEELDYLQDLNRQQLPDNITLHEFYFKPGSMVRNATAQQAYISTNYTFVARDLSAAGVNVLAQMVASREQSGRQSFSLSCNPEVSLDIATLLDQRRAQGEKIFTIAQIHPDLPYMENDAEVDPEFFDIIVDDKNAHKTLFSTPNMPVEQTDYFVGLHASTLLRDGGTLQIGIGALGDALVYSTLLRHQDNHHYRALLDALGIQQKWGPLIQSEGGDAPFSAGLYGCSEMFINGFMKLIEAGIVSRRVFPDADIQRQVNEGKLDPAQLEGGTLLHGGFFLGPGDFYQSLRQLPADLASAINMTRISYVNHLYGDETLKRLQRQNARFVNSVFTVSLLGAAASDQNEEGKVVSGVGGQYNFVAQAHELEGARSILMLRSTRERAGEIMSNIVWRYGHTTVPRHLRDIVITEYGIADLRGKSDAEVIAALLNIADSRFQLDLLKQAQEAGKIAADYCIDDAYRHNTPEHLQAVYEGFKKMGLFPTFPFGCEFSLLEQRLMPALSWLKEKTRPRHFFQLARKTLSDDVDNQHFEAHIERMGLAQPSTLKERVYRQLLHTALESTRE